MTLSGTEGTEILKRGSRFHYVEKWCRNWLWTCRKAHYIINELELNDVRLVAVIEMSFL